MILLRFKTSNFPRVNSVNAKYNGKCHVRKTDSVGSNIKSLQLLSNANPTRFSTFLVTKLFDSFSSNCLWNYIQITLVMNGFIWLMYIKIFVSVNAPIKAVSNPFPISLMRFLWSAIFYSREFNWSRYSANHKIKIFRYNKSYLTVIRDAGFDSVRPGRNFFWSHSGAMNFVVLLS